MVRVFTVLPWALIMSSRMKNFDGSHLRILRINEIRRYVHKCLCNSNFAKSWWFLLIPKLGRLSRRPLQLWYRKLVPQKLQFQDPLLNRIVFLPFWNCLNILECQISCWELLKLSEKVQRTKSVPLSEVRTFWLLVSRNIQFLEIEHILFSSNFESWGRKIVFGRGYALRLRSGKQSSWTGLVTRKDLRWIEQPVPDNSSWKHLCLFLNS